MPDKKAAEYQEATVIPIGARFGSGNPPGPPLQPQGGGGFNMEARVAKLEASVEHIQRDTADIKSDIRTLRDNARTDFRILFGAIIAATLGLAGLMARGFHWF
jgi:hypothetical protein